MCWGHPPREGREKARRVSGFFEKKGKGKEETCRLAAGCQERATALFFSEKGGSATQEVRGYQGKKKRGGLRATLENSSNPINRSTFS